MSERLKGNVVAAFGRAKLASQPFLRRAARRPT
jgi:hypothetical protein